MNGTDAFATIRRARSLTERHPDVTPSVVQVALTMATYADGKTGASIRPGLERLMHDTGLGRSTVLTAIAELIERGELRRERRGRRGSASCFTFLGVKGPVSNTLSERKGPDDDSIGSSQQHTTTQTSKSSGTSVPSDKHCPFCSGELEYGTEDGIAYARCAGECAYSESLGYV